MSQIVLITGCSSGIGHALATAFREQGATVIATARRPESLSGLRDAGCEIERLDVNDAAGRALLRTTVERRHGRIDVLVNNAGISAMGPIAEIPEAQLRAQFETNVIAPTLLTQELLPLLRRAPRGTIVNVGSCAGILITPFSGAYSASKAALHAISEAMRLELEPLGLSVVTVQPGGIRSNFGAAAAEGVEAWLTPDSAYASLRSGILARATASQQGAMPAEVFARRVVADLRDGAGPVLRLGTSHRVMVALARFAPRMARSWILRRRFGLNRLVHA